MVLAMFIGAGIATADVGSILNPNVSLLSGGAVKTPPKLASEIQNVALAQVKGFLGNPQNQQLLRQQLCSQHSADIGTDSGLRNFLRNIDGLTFGVGADLIPDSAKDWMGEILDASFGVEYAVFFKEGKISLTSYWVPQVGVKTPSASAKTSLGYRFGVTSGCNADPEAYGGYSGTISVGGMNLSLSMRDDVIGSCLKNNLESLNTLRPIQPGSVKTFQSVDAILRDSSKIESLRLALFHEADLFRPVDPLFLAHNPVGSDSSSEDLSQSLVGLVELLQPTGVGLPHDLSARFERIAKGHGAVQAVGELSIYQESGIAKLEQLQDDIASTARIFARASALLEKGTGLNRAYLDITGSGQVAAPIDLVKQFDPNSLDRFKRDWVREHKRQLNKLCSYRSDEARSDQESVSFVTIDKSHIYDCVRGEIIGPDNLKARKNSLQAMRKLVEEVSKKRQALVDLLKLVTNFKAQLISGQELDLASLKIGVDRDGAGCEQSILNGCKSVSFPPEHLVKAGTLIRETFASPQLPKNLGKSVADLLGGAVSSGVSLSHNKQITTQEYDLSDLGPTFNVFSRGLCGAVSEQRHVRAAPDHSKGETYK